MSKYYLEVKINLIVETDMSIDKTIDDLDYYFCDGDEYLVLDSSIESYEIKDVK